MAATFKLYIPTRQKPLIPLCNLTYLPAAATKAGAMGLGLCQYQYFSEALKTFVVLEFLRTNLVLSIILLSKLFKTGEPELNL